MGCAAVCPDPDNTGKLSDEKLASIVWLLLILIKVLIRGGAGGPFHSEGFLSCF